MKKKFEAIILTFQFIHKEGIEIPFHSKFEFQKSIFRKNEKSFQITNTKDHVVWCVGNCFENRDRFCSIYMGPKNEF